MSITKAKVDSHYVVISNDTAQSKTLSLEAKGLIVLMASRPEDWVFHKSQLMSDCKLGRDKLNRVFKELESSGFLCVAQRFDSDGRFKENEYIFFANNKDNPAFISPLTEKPLTVKPLTVNQPLQKKESIQKKDNTNGECSLKLKGFDHWWTNYPKKTAKPDAIKAFNSATKKMSENVFMDFVDLISFDSPKRYAETEKQYIPAPAKYIRQELYNDE